MDGYQLIEAERARQQAPATEGGEGWDPAHDDRHWVRDLVCAAQAYAEAQDASAPQPPAWPFGSAWWKPRDRVRNLVRAGALYLAAADAVRRRKGDGTGYEASLKALARELGGLIDQCEVA